MFDNRFIDYKIACVFEVCTNIFIDILAFLDKKYIKPNVFEYILIYLNRQNCNILWKLNTFRKTHVCLNVCINYAITFVCLIS